MTYSDKETERRLQLLESQIKTEYSRAASEMEQTWKNYINGYDEFKDGKQIHHKSLRERYLQEYDAYQKGAYTKAEFNAWYKTQIERGEGYRIMSEKLCNRVVDSNLVAAALINDTTPGIWALNYNYEAYRINSVYGVDFQLFDEMTIKNLLMEDNHVNFKHRWVNVDPMKSYNWNEKQINSALTAGILQGKSIDQLAENYLQVMGRNESAAIRNARTSVTSAQNSGRMESYSRAEDMGIELEKEWMSTLDSRTRDSHRDLDGEKQKNKDEFSNGLMYPGDPSGDPAEVYNCRCTMTAYLPKYNQGTSLTRAYKGVTGHREYDGNGKAKTLTGYTYKGKNGTQSFNDWVKGQLQTSPVSNAVNQANILRAYNSLMAQKLGNNYYDSMHDLLDKCTNTDLAKVWEKYESSIGVGSTTVGRGYCRGSTINMNTANDQKGSDWKAPFSTTFHESGHALDYMNSSKGSGHGFYFSTTYENGKFPETIKREVNDWVSAVDKQLKADYKLNKDNPDWLLNNGFVSQYNYDYFKDNGKWLGYAQPKYSKSHAYAKIEKEIRALPGIERGDLSDMLEGASKGKISCGYGHGKSYWNDSYALGTEAFAEMTSATITNPQSLATIQKYLPESYKVYNEMLVELLK